MKTVFVTALLMFGLLIPAVAAGQGVQPDAEDMNTHLNLPDPDAPYPFRAMDITVEDALRLFSRNLRVGLMIAEDFDGTSTAKIDLELSRQEYLDELAALFDFSWYFDGNILHISDVGAMQIEVFSLQQTNGSELIVMLQTLGVYQQQFVHRADTQRQALLVSGPESYIKVVKQVVEAVETAESRKIRVLRGSSGASSTKLSQGVGATPAPTASTEGS